MDQGPFNGWTTWINFTAGECEISGLDQTVGTLGLPRINLEIVFDIIEDPEGGYIAECLSEDIFTQADSWDALRKSVKEATQCHFMDRNDKPQRIRLHLASASNSPKNGS